MVRYGYTIFYVADVDETLAFFESAFAMNRRFISPEKDYGELDTGETILAFADHVLGQANLPNGYVRASDTAVPLGVEIALLTDGVVAAHADALAHGAVEVAPPQTKPWGQVVSYVRSPSGLLIELCTPIAP